MGMRFGKGGQCGDFSIPEALMAMRFGAPPFPPFGPGPWSFDWGGGGRRGRKRAFESGELRLVLLKLIVDEPRHGYDLIKAIEELTHGSYAPSPGVVYPTLTLLEDMGLISPAAAEGARKAYKATPEGEAYLAERAEEVEGLIQRLTGLGDDRRKAGGAPIKRAVGNLLSALWHRVTREDSSEETLHEIAAILDEAARRIERLP